MNIVSITMTILYIYDDLYKFHILQQVIFKMANSKIFNPI